jgi:hypothetical protein
VLGALLFGILIAFLASSCCGVAHEPQHDSAPERIIEIGNSLIRRCHDLSDVMAAIEVASRLVGEQLETTESANRRHDRFEEQTHGQSSDQ